jgi:TolA-binding protein
VENPEAGPPQQSLEEVLEADEDLDGSAAGEDQRLLAALNRRHEPVVVVTLLKTLGVAFGLLAGLIGVGGVVVSALYLSEWALWAGTLGSVLLIFLGVMFALFQVALARLVDTVDQAARRLNDLSRLPPGFPSAASGRLGRSQVALLAAIRDAVQLTDDEKRARRQEKSRQAIAALVEAFERHIQREEFGAAREVVAQLRRRHPEAGEVGEVARRLEEAEATALDATFRHLAEGIRAALDAQSWDQAKALADELVGKFPDDPRAREVAESVGQRYDAATAERRQHLYQRMTDLAREGRWQEALDVASDFIEHYPDSEETARLRSRIGPLAEKAALTERRRLLSAVRQESGQQHWAAAYEAARHLVNAYPDSAEAAEVFRDLPNLRRLARRK